MILVDHWTCLMTGRSLKTTHQQQARRQACNNVLEVKSLLSYHPGLLPRLPSHLARDRRLPDHNLEHTPLPPYLISAGPAQPLKKRQRQQDLTQNRSFTAQTTQSSERMNASAAPQISSGAQGGTQGNRSSSPSSRGSSNDIPIGPANLLRQSVVLPDHLQPTIVDPTRGAPSKIPKGKHSAGGWI